MNRAASEREERRLAKILAGNMVGDSRLMEAGERGTLAALKARGGELIDPKIAQHNGHIVKATGDGMPAEFASVVDAVASALEAAADGPWRGGLSGSCRKSREESGGRRV